VRPTVRLWDEAQARLAEMMNRRQRKFRFIGGLAVRIGARRVLLLRLRDARSVAVRQRSRGLDWSRIETCVADLAELKGDPEMRATLRKIRDAGES